MVRDSLPTSAIEALCTSLALSEALVVNTAFSAAASFLARAASISEITALCGRAVVSVASTTAGLGSLAPSIIGVSGPDSASLGRNEGPGRLSGLTSDTAAGSSISCSRGWNRLACAIDIGATSPCMTTTRVLSFVALKMRSANP